ncbi:MAG TPA: murein biosynthesis integral membrane protein MurJ [Terriglobales bacterium]|nr:murein biosynthesis integral membrane protein MurJ [Terriglobales bacterium]
MFSLKSVATVGGLTLTSRLLGFLRETMIAHQLGTGPVAEAFFVAMRLPNLFRQMFAEGAFNSAFVPMFARRIEEEGEAGAKLFAERVMSVLLVILICVTIGAELTMPWLMRVFAPGFHEFPEKFRIAILLTSITFPYLLFMSLCALQGGILNSLHRFTAPAAAPIMLNVTLIGTLLIPTTSDEQAGLILSIAVTLAGILQFLWLLISCRQAGMQLGLRWPHLTPEVKRMMKLMVPGLIGGGLNQINMAIATILATLIPGAVSYLYYADRLYQLPLALIGSAIGVVLLPSLTRALRGGQPELANHHQNRAIEMGLSLSLPAAVGLIVASHPIIAAVYQRGAFTAEDASKVAAALAAVAAGLPAYVLNKALAPGFLAREDTMTPFRFAMIGVGADIVVSLSLFHFIGYVGIACGTAAAAWLNSAMLYWRLRSQKMLSADQRLQRNLPRLVLSAAIMGIALWFAIPLMPEVLGAGGLARIAALLVLVAGGCAVYAVAVLATGAISISELRQQLRRRGGGAVAVKAEEQSHG